MARPFALGEAMTEAPRRGRPPKAREPEPQAPAPTRFAMIVTAPSISIGPRDALEGERIEVCEAERQSLLFWRRATDA
jgi:hypothetical protein